MEYDQKVIIKFILNERVDPGDIADRLQAKFGGHASQLRTVQFWITQGWLSHQDLHGDIRTGRPPLNDLDAKILAVFDKSFSESARSIAETLRVANSRVLLHLHNSICFRSFHLHRIPHLLMYNLRKKRNEYIKAILPFLYAAKRDDWYYLVASDESWFVLNISLRRM
jgi:hypothetical protein